MPERISTMPPIPVTVRVASGLLGGRGEEWLNRVAALLDAQLASVLDTLAIPGEPAVEIVACKPNELSEGRWLRLLVNRRECHYDDELLLRIACFVEGLPVGALPKSYVPTDNSESLIDILCRATGAIVSQYPSLLFGENQSAAYLASLAQPLSRTKAEPSWPVPQGYGRQVLSIVLDQGITLADREVIAQILASGHTDTVDAEDTAERLIEALTSPQVSVLIPDAYLRELTSNVPASGVDGFGLMRDGLFYELGLFYPRFRFEPANDLPARSFAFRVNHLESVPRRGLSPEQQLVNTVTPSGQPAINPANGNEACIVDVQEAKSLSASGFTTWDAFGYLILHFADELRRNSARLLNAAVVRQQLDTLEGAFPALVQAARARFSIAHLTRALRGLIAEQLSIRNLRLILETALDFDYIVVDGTSLIIFDDRLPVIEQPGEAWLRDARNLTAFIRTAMKRYISHLYTRGQSTLIVILMDPAIEAAAIRGSIDDRQQQQLLAAVRSELRESASSVAILTTVEARLPLRTLIGREFSRLPVLAYQELSPDMNIQPLGRISIDEIAVSATDEG